MRESKVAGDSIPTKEVSVPIDWPQIFPPGSLTDAASEVFVGALGFRLPEPIQR